MLSIVKSMALNGINGYLVEVETDVTGGLPSFDIVGLPDTTVREAKERIRAAIKNSKIEFHSRKILINLYKKKALMISALLDIKRAMKITSLYYSSISFSFLFNVHVEYTNIPLFFSHLLILN